MSSVDPGRTARARSGLAEGDVITDPDGWVPKNPSSWPIADNHIHILGNRPAPGEAPPGNLEVLRRFLGPPATHLTGIGHDC